MNLYKKLVETYNSKILIIRMSSFGDIVKTIPFYYYLYKVLPNATIYWLVKDKYVKLLQTFGILNNVSTSQLFNLSTFDTVFDLQGNLKSGILSSLIQTKYKIGFSLRYTKELNSLFRNKVINQLSIISGKSPVLQDIALNKLIVNTYNKPFELVYKVGFPKVAIPKIEPKISIDKENLVRKWLNKHNIKKFVLIHPGSSKKGINKRWGNDNFIRLIGNIKKEHNIPSVILTGQDEKDMELSFKHCSFIPEFDIGLEEMIALIKNCHIFIGNDSGPLHLSTVLGVKTLGIFTASNPSIMAHPASYTISNCHYINEKQNRNIIITIPYNSIFRKIKELLL